MNVLSLFDGISSGMVALERVGIKPQKYYASEIDKNAIRISQNNYPDIVHIGDITKLRAGDFPKLTLVMGGSPCQGFSITTAQSRGNFSDPRSQLLFNFVDLVESTAPDYFLLENVPMDKECEQYISRRMGVDPILINSNLVSAQDRKRLYWTNIPNVTLPEDRGIVLLDVMEKNADEKYFYNLPFDFHGWDKKVIATVHVSGHDILKRVYNPTGKCATLTACRGGNTQKKVFDKLRCRKLTPLEYERLQTIPDNYTAGVADSHRYNTLGDGWTVDVISHILKGISCDSGKE